MAVSQADRSIKVLAADDSDELSKVLADGVDLLLLNREMPYGFEAGLGVDMIPQLRKSYPHVKVMLISNYAEAQAAAVAAGALPGFGKREIGSPRVSELLRSALQEAPAATV